MKKTIIIFAILLIISGCNKKQIKETNITNNKDNKPKTEDITEEKIDTIIPLGLYMYTNNKRILINTYEPIWKMHNDLCSLEVYYSNENELEQLPQKELWKKYYNTYINDLNNQKIGFEIEFNTLDGYIKKQIISPEDTESHFSNYILAYLYDDINNTGYYSHITPEEHTNETIISSIKLTAGTYYEKITSDISLSVYTYNTDKKENDLYVENNKYTLIIKK